MIKYTIYCTEEQTRKALELGAPIEILPNYTEYRVFPLVKCKDGNERPCVNPTAEEMIGWLEDNGIYINFDTTSEEDENHNLIIKWQYYIYNRYHDIVNEEYIEYSSRKEATIKAIDSTLEYLSNKK